MSTNELKLDMILTFSQNEIQESHELLIPSLQLPAVRHSYSVMFSGFGVVNGLLGDNKFNLQHLQRFQK